MEWCQCGCGYPVEEEPLDGSFGDSTSLRTGLLKGFSAQEIENLARLRTLFEGEQLQESAEVFSFATIMKIQRGVAAGYYHED